MNYSQSYNCIPKSLQSIERKEISIPARRQSTFEMINHKPEGYLEGGWKSKSTRLNQIRFYNQVRNNESDLATDGLTSLNLKVSSNRTRQLYIYIGGVMKLGVCIPYRDSGDGVRQGHLDRLIPHLEEFLGKQGIDFTCYVGHQIDYEKFHRSGTKNIAYLEAKKDGCDYFAFHDVDMLPYDDCHYGHPGDSPKHIATWLSQWGYTLRDTEYFGGVVIFT